ncbi:hypothetical protein AB833_24600 [Chromatiales bacterium (ex Bugula neritina AB1)]|nr:hypothetical protein AB833_24600 [Chromatiales bacterium (ex Bugula neritina AB1)]
MAFTMAHNSLFAVLLRSAWWYSALISLVLISISLLIADGRYLIVGITAALPFTGIAAYSGYKQSQRPGKNRIIEVTNEARKMSARDVANRIAVAYQAQRYSTTAFMADGAELELTRGPRILLLSTSRFKAANTGVEPLKKLLAAGAKVEATGYLYVMLGRVSANVEKFAQANNIEIINAERLTALFDKTAKID